MRGFGDHGFSFGDDPFGMRAAFRASPWGAWDSTGGADAGGPWTFGWAFDPTAMFAFPGKLDRAAAPGLSPFDLPPMAAPAVTLMMLGAFAAGAVAGFTAAAALSAITRGARG